MAVVDYPFIQVAGKDAGVPALWVKVTNPATGQSVRTLARIDTGADQSAAPMEFAEILGCDLEKMETARRIQTAGGARRVFTRRLALDVLRVSEIVDQQQKKISEETVFRTMEMPITFVTGLTTLLLGADGFLDNFVLTVDYTQQAFSLRPTSDYVK